MTTLSVVPDWLPTGTALTGPMVAAGVAGLVLFGALAVGVILLVRRTVRAFARSVERGGWTGRRVLIVVAILAALGVAGIGGARSFGAVSAKFNSPLVPLVADGMIIACTALRLAALTRGWRIPGALLTTYVFIGGTVWLNIDTATGIADAIAHALAPLAYAVLVEMLAHMLRLQMKLAQPTRAKLSVLTWFTSPVITTRVWLHLARTGTDDPVAARALVQQVVRMASRLESICPSRKTWPLDSARAARTAALQTIRDGLLSAGELATLLPTAGRLTPGELLALVDSAALGLTSPTAAEPETRQPQPAGLPGWVVGFALGALRGAPVQESGRTDSPAPVRSTGAVQGSAPVQQPLRTGSAPEQSAPSMDATTKTAPTGGRARRSDDDDLAELLRVSAAKHGGAPPSQREITRVLDCGFGVARRLAEKLGWLAPTADDSAPRAVADAIPEATEIRGQLQLITEPGENPTEDQAEETSTDREFETSSTR